MKLQDIKILLSTRQELEDLSSDIFDYVKYKYQDFLKFNRYSNYDDFYINEKNLSISYYDHGYDIYQTEHLPDIPIELLESESDWKSFLDNYYQKKKEEKENWAKKEEQEKEDKERKLYEELKKKYE